MDLSNEKMSSRKRQANLVDDLVKALQSKDSAVTAIKKLEKLCIESGMQQVATFHELEEGLKSAAELGSRYPPGIQYGSSSSSASAVVPASPAPADLESRWRSQQNSLASEPRWAGQVKRYTSPLISGSNSYKLQTTGRGLGSLRVGRSLPSALSSAASGVGSTSGGFPGSSGDEEASVLNTASNGAVEISPMTDRSATATPSTYKKRVTINRGYKY